MTKILEIDNCSECKYCGGGVMSPARCDNERTKETKLPNYPDIPEWCPLINIRVLKDLHDGIVRLNGDLGSKGCLCLLCKSNKYDSSGIVHADTCPILEARKVNVKISSQRAMKHAEDLK